MTASIQDLDVADTVWRLNTRKIWRQKRASERRKNRCPSREALPAAARTPHVEQRSLSQGCRTSPHQVDLQAYPMKKSCFRRVETDKFEYVFPLICSGRKELYLSLPIIDCPENARPLPPAIKDPVILTLIELHCVHPMTDRAVHSDKMPRPKRRSAHLRYPQSYSY